MDKKTNVINVNEIKKLIDNVLAEGEEEKHRKISDITKLSSDLLNKIGALSAIVQKIKESDKFKDSPRVNSFIDEMSKKISECAEQLKDMNENPKKYLGRPEGELDSQLKIPRDRVRSSDYGSSSTSKKRRIINF